MLPLRQMRIYNNNNPFTNIFVHQRLARCQPCINHCRRVRKKTQKTSFTITLTVTNWLTDRSALSLWLFWAYEKVHSNNFAAVSAASGKCIPILHRSQEVLWFCDYVLQRSSEWCQSSCQSSHQIIILFINVSILCHSIHCSTVLWAYYDLHIAVWTTYVLHRKGQNNCTHR